MDTTITFWGVRGSIPAPGSDTQQVGGNTTCSEVVLGDERVVGALDGAAAVVNLLPTAALLATGERATAGIDFVCSNVRAAPFDLYIAGALMEANYPVGPLAGTAFNLTTMSYRGYLFIGLHVDSGAITEPQVLLDGIEAAYQDLFEAARRRA